MSSVTESTFRSAAICAAKSGFDDETPRVPISGSRAVTVPPAASTEASIVDGIMLVCLSATTYCLPSARAEPANDTDAIAERRRSFFSMCFCVCFFLCLICLFLCLVFFRGERAMLAIRQTDVNTLLAYFFYPCGCVVRHRRVFRCRSPLSQRKEHRLVISHRPKKKSRRGNAPAASPIS